MLDSCQRRKLCSGAAFLPKFPRHGANVVLVLDLRLKALRVMLTGALKSCGWGLMKGAMTCRHNLPSLNPEIWGASLCNVLNVLHLYNPNLVSPWCRLSRLLHEEQYLLW